MSKRITIITTSAPAANPRALKEAIALKNDGYDVTFIYLVTTVWTDRGDEEIIKEHSEINWLKSGEAVSNKTFLFVILRLRRKLYEIGFRLGFRKTCGDYVLILQGQELYKTAKKIKSDFIIAHNLGALPVAYKIAKHQKIPFAFDAEDFHRGEMQIGSFHYEYIKYLENKYIPYVYYLSCSSPLAAVEYKKLYPFVQIITILNVFSVKSDFIDSSRLDITYPIKLFWFSQVIGKGRGLEAVFKALQNLPEGKFSLTLLGNISKKDKAYFDSLIINKKQSVFYHPPVSPNEIFFIAKKHDIGLALEPGRDQNNKIALSNKIFTYLICGNSVIFSNTLAQEIFFNQNPGIGLIFSCGNYKDLTQKLEIYLNNFEILIKHKSAAHSLAMSKFNWDFEKDKFLLIIKKGLE